MKPFGKTSLLFACLLTLVMVAAPVWAARPVAKVTSFEGEVMVVSGIDIVPVSHIGQFVGAGDKIQTQQGRVELTFNDGAQLKVSPFSTMMVQERQEESGFLFFKKKISVRRITNYVGNLWFKSGASERKNFIQTTTAVCGLRGTIVEAKVTLAKALIKFNEGSGDIAGAMQLVQQALTESTRGEAANNKVYQAIVLAAQQLKAAQTAQAAQVAAEAAVTEAGDQATPEQLQAAQEAKALAEITIAAAKRDVASTGIIATVTLLQNPELSDEAKAATEVEKNAFVLAQKAAEAEQKVAELEAVKATASPEDAEKIEAALEAIDATVETLQQQSETALEAVTEETLTPELIATIATDAQLAESEIAGIDATINETGAAEVLATSPPPDPAEREEILAEVVTEQEVVDEDTGEVVQEEVVEEIVIVPPTSTDPIDPSASS